MRKLYRKIKAWLTGKKPCSYTSNSGHVLMVVGRSMAGSPLIVLYSTCQVCGANFRIDRWSRGWEAHNGRLPRYMEPVVGGGVLEDYDG